MEEREAAILSGYTWKEWLTFDILTLEGRLHRASGVAFYRLHHLIEQHADDAVTQDIERRSKARE